MIDVLTIATAVAVFAYLFATWWRISRNPERGVRVTRYEPPMGLSPAMLRYVWKEAFDDRTFWAAALNLVAKGFATLEASNGDARLRPTVATAHAAALPEEEQVLLDRVLLHHGRKGAVISMLDGGTEYTVMSMAASLRKRAVGKWFRQNREHVVPAAEVCQFFCVNGPGLFLGLGMGARGKGQRLFPRPAM